MRWIHRHSPADEAALQSEYTAARNLGKVRLGEAHLFFSKFSGTSYLSYSQIRHAWIRIEEVNARLCCGRANFDQIFLMVEDNEGSIRRADMKSREQAQNALTAISQRNPSAEIGYYKSEPA